MITTSYFYFSTHTINQSIYGRLQASSEYENLSDEDKNMLDKLVYEFDRKKDFNENPIDFCSRFIKSNSEELSSLISEKGYGLKFFLTKYLGFKNLWGASTRSFGKSSDKRAERIEEDELISEMTDPKSSTIKKLLESGGFNLSNVKPFLPAVMVSLDTNSRNKSIMSFKHTGRFSFDFDGFKDREEARVWLNKLWEGTDNIRPYLAFISPRGKGVKLFCRVDVSSKMFSDDYISEDRLVVMKRHKEWYEGARKELLSKFPDLTDKFDNATKDLQRLTYIPFIASPAIDFKYNKDNISKYDEVVQAQRDHEMLLLQDKMSEHSKEISKIMKEKNITNKLDAYDLILKDKKYDFDLDYETEKFIKVVDFLESLSLTDNRVSNWVAEKFSDYATLHKISWVLFGVFGEMAIEQIKRLIPSDSNKLDENHTDYRWAIRSKSDYDDDILSNLNPGAFYKLVGELGEVRDFMSETFSMTSKHVSDLKMLSSYYETYVRNLELSNDKKTEDSADLSEFLDEVTGYLDKKKIRLPLVKELEDLKPEVILGPKDYLDKKTMTDLYQIKYADKRIFSLRSQCGTGKNTLAGNPTYKLKGRVILAEPYKSISEQAASEAWINGDRGSQLFVNSTIETTLLSFKEDDKDAIKVNFENTLKGTEIPEDDELVIHTTYNQIMNMSFDDLATIDYIFIDESHTLSDGLSYRSDVIAGLLTHLIEFVAKQRSEKTKIIFMSGTPNVETHVIPELMAEYNIGDLFQRVIINKSYTRSPRVNLTHLDTAKPIDRQNAVINQINSYIKAGRKVCHIFNNKAKMDSYIRDIQSKLSDNIKVGLFYSGSTGDCTRNILEGKIGDYDVILTTTYFINGINIEKDGLSQKDILSGKESKQKYGVIIDMGQGHTRVNAMDAVQAINRFRNRRVHATIFLPKIFKEDKLNPSRPFNYNHAGRVLLGINKFNHEYLSVLESSDIVEEFVGDEDKEMEDLKKKLLLIEKAKKNPIFISAQDLDQANKVEERRAKVVSLITKKLRVYEDWFNSMDGYHFLAKDAGFISIIKHSYISTDLDDMSKKHVELENEVIRNFINNDKAITYLSNQLDSDKRILVKSSGKVKDPEDTSVGNFKVIKLINNKYIVAGDFHISHERVLNRIIKQHLRLSYLYTSDISISIIRAVIDPRLAILPGMGSSYSGNISEYVKGCKNVLDKEWKRAYGFIKGISMLISNGYPGLARTEDTTYTAFSLEKSDEVYKIWAETQYDNLIHKINKSSSTDKDILLNYYSNKPLVMDYEIAELVEELKYLGIYKKQRVDKDSNVTSPEQLFIPKVLSSKQVLLASSEEDINEWEAPIKSDVTKFNSSIQDLLVDTVTDIKSYSDKIKSLDVEIYNKIDSDIISSIKSGKLSGIYIAREKMMAIKKMVSPAILGENYLSISSRIDLISNKLNTTQTLIRDAFIASEYFLYNEYKKYGKSLFVENLLLMETGKDLETLYDPVLSDSDLENVLVRSEIEDIILKSLNHDISKIRGKSKFYIGITKTMELNDETNISEYKYVPVAAGKNKTSFAENLISYASVYNPFMTKFGIVKGDKGAYNKSTFLRDYFLNQDELSDKRFLNYVFIKVEIPRQELKNRLKQLEKEKKSS